MNQISYAMETNFLVFTFLMFSAVKVIGVFRMKKHIFVFDELGKLLKTVSPPPDPMVKHKTGIFGSLSQSRTVV